MAARYWVGGSGTWTATNTTNWSASTGGTGGATVPTSTDDVYFDANSGTSASVIEVQASNGVNCLNFTNVGFTGTIGNSTTSSNQRRINIYGNCILGGSGTFAPTLYPQVFFQGAADVTQEITCGGQDMGIVVFNGAATTTYKFMDDFKAIDTQNEVVTHNQGIIDANNKNVFMERIQSGNPTTPASAVRTVNMGTGTWTIYGGRDVGQIIWDARDSVNLTINKSTSIINLNNGSGVGRTFYTGGKSYGKLIIGNVGGANGYTSILGGGSFTELASIKEAPSSVIFSSGQTTTVTKFSACGSYNNSDWLGSLVATIDDTQTTGIETTNVSATIPTSGTIKIGSEVISYTGTAAGGVGTVFTGVTRGANGTTKAPHTAGSIVYIAYYLYVYSDASPTQASLNTSTPSGVFYVGSNSINGGNNSGVTFSAGYILDYMVISNLLVSTTRSISPTMGYSGVANQIQTTPGNASGAVGNANAGLGDDVGGSGVVDQYTGVS